MKATEKASLPSILTLYLLGIAQGVGFTTIPAAANFLTSPSGFGFTSYEYGNLFILMIFGSIFASFFGGILAKRYGNKMILSAAGVLNILSMAVFSWEATYIRHIEISYPLLMVGMFFLGSGFGANLTALNSYAFHFFPKRSETAITALHACLGIGTAIGPLLFTYYYQKGIWWEDPVAIAFGYLFLLISVLAFFPKAKTSTSSSSRSFPFSFLFWVFATLAFLYGICETTFGNWGTIFLHTERQVSLPDANYALALFWGAITLGRIAISLMTLVLSAKKIYVSLSFLLLVSLLLIHTANTPPSAMVAFALAGIGCSGFLPLTFSFAQSSFPSLSQLVSGFITGVYMLGYGASSWGVGSLEKRYSLSLGSIFSWMSILVLCLAICSIFICQNKKVAD